MQTGTLTINGETIAFRLQKRRGSRSLRLAVGKDGTALISVPWFIKSSTALDFLHAKAAWFIAARTTQAEARKKVAMPPGHHSQFTGRAKKIISEKLKQFNEHYHFTYHQISIRNQSSRWGSCSRSGNLSFNYKLLFVGEELLDYVVVHELCHLKEMNHGPKFWKLVSERIPDWEHRRRQLRQIHL